MAKIKTTDTISGATGILSSAVGNLTDTFEYTPTYRQSTGPLQYQQEQTLTPKGATVGGTVGAMASGAASGAAFGPIGMGIGAAIGGITSIFGANARKRKMQRENQRIADRNLYRKAEAQTTQLQNEYNTNEQNAEMTYMNKGGKFKLNKPIGNINARVDEGETIMSHGGEMQTVENSNPNTTEVKANTTDGYVTSLRDGDKVLSNKIKMPGTNKTFAEAGQKLEAKMTKLREGKYKSQVESNTARLNESNLTKQYNALFEQQEALKPKETGSGEGYAKGGQYGAPQMMSKKFATDFDAIDSVKHPHTGYLMQAALPGFDEGGQMKDIDAYNDDYIRSLAKQADPETAKRYDYLLNETRRLQDMKDPKLANMLDRKTRQLATLKAALLPGEVKPKELLNDVGYQPRKSEIVSMAKFKEGGVYNKMPGFADGGKSGRLPNAEYIAATQPKGIQNLGWSPSDKVLTDLKDVQHRINNSFGNYIPDYSLTSKLNMEKESQFGLSDLSNIAPALMNVASSFGKTDKMHSVSPEELYTANPYESQALSMLGKRRLNMQPMLQKNVDNAAIARYNARQAGIGGRTYDLATAASKMKADQDVLARYNDAQNQYLSDYANALSQFGGQRAQGLTQAKQAALSANRQAQDYNARVQAAKQNLLSTGLSDISKYTQMKQRNAQQDYIDQQMLNAYQKYFGNFDTNAAAMFNLRKPRVQ